MTTAGGVWAEADRLIKEQKFAEALAIVSSRRAAAQAAGDEVEWTRALVRETQLTIGLHGYETAVRQLRTEPWPKGLAHRAVLELFYARSLETYLVVYSWEIQQRERVEASGAVDLKAWTAAQIGEEASRAYLRLWTEREELGRMRVDALAEFVAPNTYPAGIRDTVRDALSYFFAAHLADASAWSPSDANEVFRLDLAALLAGNEPGKPQDASLHPLLRLVAVLGDLERWHASREQREGELEARLERTRRLAQSFTEGVDRKKIEDDLARRLPSFRDVAWFAEGKAQLAKLVESMGELARARSVAREGRDAYPDSVGGRDCRSVIERIEEPSFQVESMWIDGLDRRSIRVQHKNLARLHFRSYALDFEARLAKAGNFNRILPDSTETVGIVDNEKPEAQWTVELPATPDFQMHSTFVVPRVRGPGLHLVVASPNPRFSGAREPVLATSYFLSDLVLVSRSRAGAPLEVQALSGASGKPIPGAEVALWKASWNPEKVERLASARTDASGFARLTAPEEKQWAQRFVTAKHDRDLAYEPNVWFQPANPPDPPASSLVFTDRSVYRPLQKVLWKVIAYRGDRWKGKLAVFPQTPVTLTLVDANNQSVATQSVTTNEFGSAAGEFAVPAGRVLGAWRVTSSLGAAAAGIRVEEYKRPSFEVSLQDPKEPLRLNRPAALRGEARYYFGLPVTSGEARWRVVRTPQYWWWCFYGWGFVPDTRSQTVASGRSVVGDDGTFPIAFTPVADERDGTAKLATWRYEVTADVVDEGGETRTASRTFRLGFVSVEAHLESVPGFLREGAASRLTMVRTDLDGVARAGRGKWTLWRLEQPAAPVLPAEQPAADRPRPGRRGARKPKGDSGFSTPGDVMRARWETDFAPPRTMAGWKTGAETAHGSVAHDSRGKAILELPPLSAGAYRLRYETADEQGAVFELPSDILVAGARTPIALPAVLQAREDTCAVGGTASFLATSGFAGQPLLFEKYRGGHVVERRSLAAGRSPAVLDLPVTESDRGGFAVRLSTMRDHQLVTLETTVAVPWDDKRLEIRFATFRDKLTPGGRETWTVRVEPKAKDGKGEVGAAELLAYMYDRSLDVFAPHTPPSVEGVYPYGTYADMLRVALQGQGFVNIRGGFPGAYGFVPPHGDYLKIPSGYATGGPGVRGFAMDRLMAVDESRNQALEKEGVSLQAATRSKSAVYPASAPAEPKRRADMKTGTVGGLVAGYDSAGAPAPEVQLRSNFAETAFWRPALRTDANGAASIEFTVPDSVTAWRVWVHGVTKGFQGGSVSGDARSVKELMVRPYVPRFLREGDRAELQVAVDNASDGPLSGTVQIDVLDAETNASVLAEFGLTPEKARQPFTAAAGKGAHVAFAVTAPARARGYAIRATAVAGNRSDGELRPVPVLPGRMSLAQSRFVTLHGNDSRTLVFDDMRKRDDPSRVDEQLVVTVDAQLFDSVLQALPYLVNYPYECTEQTLNRFVSTSIVSAVFRDHPAVASLAASMAKERSARLASWDAGASDPSRRMALEETPWLEASRGGADTGRELARILDPQVAKAEREAAIEKLRKAQTPSGGFPWWPGGPPSAYMTVYILHGFANAVEAGAEVPKDMVEKAWAYVRADVWRDLEVCMGGPGLCSLVTFVNYTLSCYPDPSWYKGVFTEADRKRLLDYSWARWKLHSPYLKGQLALTLVRMKRPADAKLVWASVMDSSKTDRDLGTFWAPEDRAWLWYNDTIETQAFALRTLMEVEPSDSRRHGLVQWLFLNKKMNQWKSTRATAEVIASLVRYLKKEGLLGLREEAAVTAGGRRTVFAFEPERYTGARNQVVVPGGKLDPSRDATVTVEKTTKGMSFASATWHFSTEKLPAEDRGDFFGVSRRYFRREPTTSGFVLKPLMDADGVSLTVGDEIEVQISLTSKHEAEYVHLRDPRPAGTEPVKQTSGWRWDLGLSRYEEVRDSGENFFFEQLPVGQYTLKYRLRASMAGTFKVAPATVQSMYAPEFHAYSAGDVVSIVGKR